MGPWADVEENMRLAGLTRLAVSLLIATLLLGISSPSAAPAASIVAAAVPAAQAAAHVRHGLIGSASDAAFFIAMDRGYFHEQGIELETTPFDSAARMVAPLGAGQLDVGGGAHNAG